MCFSIISEDSFSVERFPDRKEESVTDTDIGILIIHKIVLHTRGCAQKPDL